MTSRTMLLAIDIGNTNIVFGYFEGTLLLAKYRCESTKDTALSALSELSRRTFARESIEFGSVTGAIIASVVPSLTNTIATVVRDLFVVSPVVVCSDTRFDMPILCDQPSDVGSDRIVNAVAAFDAVRDGVVVIDFGTATTFDCVSPDGEFLGGVIVPGIETAASALVARAAKLAPVAIETPHRVVGRNTRHAMQSGLTYGYASLTDGMIARINSELGFPCKVLATGGLASVIQPLVSSIDKVLPDLTLEGLRLVYEINRGK